MGYGIMRVEKRGRSAVYGLQIEANRTQEEHVRGRDFDNSDIDWESTQCNTYFKHCENWNSAITEQIHTAGCKERKDSIVMLDCIFTASPEFFTMTTKQQQTDFWNACLEFYVQEYCQGDSSRVINAVLHYDETTPHLHVASVPLVEDEKGMHLSAKIIMGGKQDYRLRQDRFFDRVSKHYGLERGEVRDPAMTKAHTTKREWQKATQEEELVELSAKLETAKKEYLSYGELTLRDVKKSLIGDSVRLPYEEAIRLIRTAERVEQADHVLTDAEDTKRASLKVLLDAKHEANRIIQHANTEAERIVKDAEQQANGIRQQSPKIQLEQLRRDYPMLDKHFSPSGIYKGIAYDRAFTPEISHTIGRGHSI